MKDKSNDQASSILLLNETQMETREPYTDCLSGLQPLVCRKPILKKLAGVVVLSTSLHPPFDWFGEEQNNKRELLRKDGRERG